MRRWWVTLRMLGVLALVLMFTRPLGRVALADDNGVGVVATSSTSSDEGATNTNAGGDDDQPGDPGDLPSTGNGGGDDNGSVDTPPGDDDGSDPGGLPSTGNGGDDDGGGDSGLPGTGGGGDLPGDGPTTCPEGQNLTIYQTNGKGTDTGCFVYPDGTNCPQGLTYSTAKQTGWNHDVCANYDSDSTTPAPQPDEWQDDAVVVNSNISDASTTGPNEVVGTAVSLPDTGVGTAVAKSDFRHGLLLGGLASVALLLAVASQLRPKLKL